MPEDIPISRRTDGIRLPGDGSEPDHGAGCICPLHITPESRAQAIANLKAAEAPIRETHVTLAMQVPLGQLLSMIVFDPDEEDFTTSTVGELVARRIVEVARPDWAALRTTVKAEIRQAIRAAAREAISQEANAESSLHTMIVTALRSQLHGNGGTSTPIDAWIGGEVMHRLIGLDVTKAIVDEFDRAVQRARQTHLG